MKAESQASSSQYAVTRSNLRRAARSTYSYDEVNILKVPGEGKQVNPSNVSFFEEMFIPLQQQREAQTSVDDGAVEEYRVREWGLMSRLGCCYG